MAKKVTIWTDDGQVSEVRGLSDEDARWYDDAPFTTPHVTATQITDDD